MPDIAQPALVCAIGLHTGAGFSVAANSAAFRGGLSAYEHVDWLPAKRDGRPLLVARNPMLRSQHDATERMLELGVGALRECFSRLEFRADAQPAPSTRYPLFLSTPAPRPGLDDDAGSRLFARLVAETALPIDRERSGLMDTGHHGGLALLQHAMGLLSSGALEACVLGGLDSYLSIDALDWLDLQYRLKAPDCPDGFVPGEGAGFVLLAAPSFAQRLASSPRLACLAADQQIDETPWYDGVPRLGNGLARVAQALLDPHDRQVRMTYSDLNGESWRVDEWSVAYLRTGKRHHSPLDLRHPAETWGDLGAATGPALMALGAFELERETRRIPKTALVLASSDTTPYRGGCLLTSQARTDIRRIE